MAEKRSNSSSRRSCLNHPDNFCYICGKYTPPAHRKKLAKTVKIAYKRYFGCPVGDQDKTWAPHISCNACRTSLLLWLSRKRKKMPFAVPMVWREQSNHCTDCYFCMTKIGGFSRKNKSKIVYPVCISAIKPVPHDLGLPVPVPPPTAGDEEHLLSEEAVSSDASSDIEMASSFGTEEKKPVLVNQERLNDLVRDISLSKEKAEVLASRLKQWNLLEAGTKISSFRDRHKTLSSYFETQDGICFCRNINGLMNELGYQHSPVDWRLFIDSSKVSLKAVLLHNNNSKPSIPVAHSTSKKETCETMDTLLKLLDYTLHNWKICGDLKVISLLLGLQLGYTKHMCFLCLWDSR